MSIDGVNARGKKTRGCKVLWSIYGIWNVMRNTRCVYGGENEKECGGEHREWNRSTAMIESITRESVGKRSKNKSKCYFASRVHLCTSFLSHHCSLVEHLLPSAHTHAFPTHIYLRMVFVPYLFWFDGIARRIVFFRFSFSFYLSLHSSSSTSSPPPSLSSLAQRNWLTTTKNHTWAIARTSLRCIALPLAVSIPISFHHK